MGLVPQTNTHDIVGFLALKLGTHKIDDSCMVHNCTQNTHYYLQSSTAWGIARPPAHNIVPFAIIIIIIIIDVASLLSVTPHAYNTLLLA